MTSRRPRSEPGSDNAFGAPSARKRATINDIARLAGVSKKTVSRVINRSPFVKVETRDKVNAIIKELGYRPDPQARGLAFRRSFLIGMIYDNPNPQYVVNVQQGILDAVRDSGLELVVHPCNRASPGFLDQVQAFVEQLKLFGVVLTPSVSEDDDLVAILRDLDCPYVRVASVSLDDAERMIVTHDAAGAAEAARHLADLGHRRVAFISGLPSFRSSHERRRGFAEGLAERGLELEEHYVVEGAYTYDSGVACARKLLAMDVPPTAIFTGNDEMAAGVYTAARDAGVSIPGDLSVIGYDDSPMAARLWPPLTSVRLPIRDMGRFAAEKLIVLANAESDTSARHPEVRPGLAVRESTARPR